MTPDWHIEVSARAGELTLDVSLRGGPGILVLTGPNGAGKSTLLRVVLGLQPATRSVVQVAGQSLHERPAALRQLGYVPQDQGLLPHLDVTGNLRFALSCRGLDHSPQRLAALLEAYGLTALARRRTHHLSGGERQRVALARALSADPIAVLLDEPFSALDTAARPVARQQLAAWAAQHPHIPILLVSHDAADAEALGARMAVLDGGKLVHPPS